MGEDKDILNIIGENICTARKQKGYTQEKLACLLDKTSKYVSMIERGQSGLSITSIVNLCNSLNIEPNSLFNGIIDYENSEDRYIINSLSTLTKDDKDFLVSVIKYVLNKSKK